ncbi:MAG: DUF418 domain-containing protein [Gemmatimonadetes bacterium]|nr:DUF418 domain-containing protein [Gemmatimonadota bacterium]
MSPDRVPTAHERPTGDPSRATPVGEADRIRSLDVLRGFAVLGILTMNIGSFSMPAAAYQNPTVWGSLDGLNGWVWRLTHLFGDLKFMAIFSMLFGAGVVLMAERREARGARAGGLHLKRMFWLLVFGLVHAYALWYGDILVWYALTGTLVYVFRRRRPRTLIALALLSWIVGSGVMAAAGLSVSQWPPEDVAEAVADMDPPREALEAEVATYRGGWLRQNEHRVPQSLSMHTEVYPVWGLWRVGGLMLFGMALFKLGVFSALARARTYGAMIAAGLLVGIPLISLGMARNAATDWAAPDFFFLGSLYNYWGSIPVALGWVGVVMLICQSGALSGLTARLAAVGRMAFTNYIAQTVICTTLFYGHGLGLFGSIDRVGQGAIVVAIWTLLIVASPWWLSRYQAGPLEWLWRSLVYGRRQPFRRVAGG